MAQNHHCHSLLHRSLPHPGTFEDTIIHFRIDIYPCNIHWIISPCSDIDSMANIRSLRGLPALNALVSFGAYSHCRPSGISSVVQSFSAPFSVSSCTSQCALLFSCSNSTRNRLSILLPRLVTMPYPTEKQEKRKRGSNWKNNSDWLFRPNSWPRSRSSKMPCVKPERCPCRAHLSVP